MELNIQTPHDIGDCVAVAIGKCEIHLGVICGVDIKAMDNVTVKDPKIVYRIRYAKSQAIYDAKPEDILFNIKILKSAAAYDGVSTTGRFMEYVDVLHNRFCDRINGVGLEEKE